MVQEMGSFVEGSKNPTAQTNIPTSSLWYEFKVKDDDKKTPNACLLLCLDQAKVVMAQDVEWIYCFTRGQFFSQSSSFLAPNSTNGYTMQPSSIRNYVFGWPIFFQFFLTCSFLFHFYFYSLRLKHSSSLL
jgi:hypothetical protein